MPPIRYHMMPKRSNQSFALSCKLLQMRKFFVAPLCDCLNPCLHYKYAPGQWSRAPTLTRPAHTVLAVLFNSGRAGGRCRRGRCLNWRASIVAQTRAPVATE